MNRPPFAEPPPALSPAPVPLQGAAAMVPAGAPFPPAPGPSGPLGAPSPGPSGPLGAPAERPGFGAGVGALFSGFGFVITNPAVWPFALVPVVVLVVVASGVSVGGYELISRPLVAAVHHWSSLPQGAVTGVAKVLAGAVAILVGLLVGAALAQPLSGPALERIVRRVETKLGMPTWPETSLAVEIGRSIEGLLVTATLALPIFAFLFLIDLLFPPAVIVTTPIKVAVTALTCAWDLCDYPLSIHGVGIRARVALLRRHIGAVFGFGLGIALLSLLPCALLLALPAGVAGATRLIARIEAWERANPA